MSRPDPGIAQRRATDPRQSVWVSASAGTGKTKVLTDRVLALLLAGNPPERLLCLTFTKAAAAEMANRIATRLAAWATAPDPDLSQDLAPLLASAPTAQQLTAARRLFARLLDTPGGMRIETIHAFCQSLLRRFPLEAGLAPHFQVMDDRDSGELLALAREELLGDGDADLAAALSLVTDAVHEQNFPDLMGQLANERGRLLRLLQQYDGSLAALLAALRARLGLAPDDDSASLIAAAGRIDQPAARRVMTALLAGKKSDSDRGALMADWLAEPATRGQRFALWRQVFLTDKNQIRARLCTQEVEAAHPGTRQWLEQEAARVLDLVDRLRALAGLNLTGALLHLALRLIAGYQEHKQRRALLDYDDLILRTITVLQRDRGAAWVLYKLDGGIDHLLIDEAQDTNPDQWAVIRALTAEFFSGDGRAEAGRRTLFAVGDPKQSIYSFQRADPREFEASRQELAARVPAAGGGWDQVALETSFRSTAPVLALVDHLLAGPGGVGVASPGESVQHRVWRAGAAGRVEMWAPVEPKPQDAEQPWRPPVERREGDYPSARLARQLAGYIHHLISGAVPLESRGRAITAGDILVLVRRRNAFVDQLVRALKRIGVPVAGADRMVLTEQLAVMDLMALAEVLLLPEDDLTLATVLKGPLVGLSEEALFTLAWNRPGTLWQSLRDGPYQSAAQWLQGLAAKVDYWTPHEFFSHVLNQGGKQRLLARLGPEAEDPLDEFIALALTYEQVHPPSLQGFLQWLREGGTEIKRDLDHGGGAVRIMTVHGAKGLQAPILFLPDSLQKPRRRPSLLWLDEALPFWPAAGGLCHAAQAAQALQDQARDAEYRRLLYVAMTRAEDRLYICGWASRQKPPDDCWYRLIEATLQQIGEEGFDPDLARLGIEPAVLRLDSNQRAPVTPGSTEESAAPSPPLPDWARRPAPTEPTPPRPLTPSRPDIEPARRDFPRSGGGSRQRGSLIHRLLQILPDHPEPDRALAAARFLGRGAWGLSYADQADIAGEVTAVMQDPRFAALFGPSSRPELPLIGQLGDRVVSGRVDRLVVQPDRVLVVDYKTDRAPPEQPPVAYLRQMAAYRAVLACVYPGRAVHCALLWTAGPRWMMLDSAALDDTLAAMA